METYMAADLPFNESPVVPEMSDGSKIIQFECRKGISCERLLQQYRHLAHPL